MYSFWMHVCRAYDGVCDEMVKMTDGLPWWVWGDGSLQTQPQWPLGDISAAPLHSCAHGNAWLHKRQSRPGSAVSTDILPVTMCAYICTDLAQCLFTWLLQFILMLSVCFLRHSCNHGRQMSTHDRDMSCYYSKNYQSTLSLCTLWHSMIAIALNQSATWKANSEWVLISLYIYI